MNWNFVSDKCLTAERPALTVFISPPGKIFGLTGNYDADM
jgi:hypothetical protein